MFIISKKFRKFQLELALSLRTRYRKVGGLPMAMQKGSAWLENQTIIEFLLMLWLEWIAGLYLLLGLLPRETAPAILLDKPQPTSVALAALILIVGLPVLALVLNFFTPVLQLAGGLPISAIWLAIGLLISLFFVKKGRKWLKAN